MIVIVPRIQFSIKELPGCPYCKCAVVELVCIKPSKIVFRCCDCGKQLEVVFRSEAI